jgi:hypothetical protein
MRTTRLMCKMPMLDENFAFLNRQVQHNRLQQHTLQGASVISPSLSSAAIPYICVCVCVCMRVCVRAGVHLHGSTE